MKVLLDMNLPPSWCDSFREQGHDALHWSLCGDPRASDRDVMAFALTDGRIVITYDLDFGALLAATGAKAPSVVIIRAGDISAPAVKASVLAALAACTGELATGAIVTVDEARRRVRVLPLPR